MPRARLTNSAQIEAGAVALSDLDDAPLDGERAQDEQAGSDERQPPLELQLHVASDLRRGKEVGRWPLGRIGPADEVRREEAAEEHDFGRQEQDKPEHAVTEFLLVCYCSVCRHSQVSSCPCGPLPVRLVVRPNVLMNRSGPLLAGQSTVPPPAWWPRQPRQSRFRMAPPWR